MIFGNFPLGGGWEIFGLHGGLPLWGAPKSRGAEDFHKLCKNVMEKFLKNYLHIPSNFSFLWIIVSWRLSWQHWLYLICNHTKCRPLANLDSNFLCEICNKILLNGIKMVFHENLGARYLRGARKLLLYRGAETLGGSKI